MAALVLLHGYPFDHTMWDRVVPDLRSKLTILTPDLRGFGTTPVGRETPGLEVMADDLAGMLSRENHEQAVVVGFSMGGYVALAFAQRHPDRLAGLALINSQPAADSDAMRKVRQTMIERVQREGALVAAEAALPKMFAQAERAPADLADYPRRGAERAGPNGIVWALQAMARRPDRTTVLRAIQTPILLLHTELDQFVPVEQARELARALPQAHYVEIRNAGHCSPLEAPAAVAAAIDKLVIRCQKT